MGAAFKVPLACGGEALVSEQDYEAALKHAWRACKRGYARGTVALNTRMTMHRWVFERAAPGVKFVTGHVIDHINGVTLDNRRENLRLATYRQNSLNIKQRTDSSSGYRGVRKVGKNFFAVFQLRQPFETAEEAARQYDKWARVFNGGFARLNFPRTARGELGAVLDWEAILSAAQVDDLTVAELSEELGLEWSDVDYRARRGGVELRKDSAPNIQMRRVVNAYRRKAG